MGPHFNGSSLSKLLFSHVERSFPTICIAYSGYAASVLNLFPRFIPSVGAVSK